jgi:ERCC4-type nuclease
MEIIVDDREKAVFPFLEDASHKYHIDYKIQRNEVGDYAICYKGYILMIIERKTWEDLSASMRDGRKNNVQKLIAVREKTGCQIAYLIEGNATPPFDKKYGRLPVKNLRAHLDHLAIRDGIHMLYSKDLEYTANRLFELAYNYSTTKEVIKNIDELESQKETSKEDDSKENSKANTGGNESVQLTTKQDTAESKITINEQILRALPGVGSIISSVLAENGITLHKLYYEPDVDTLASYKYATGATIGLVKMNKIITGVKRTFTSESEASHKARLRILSCIPLISKATAEKILGEINLLDIIDRSITADELAAFQKTEKTKLGAKAANNIVLYLSKSAN